MWKGYKGVLTAKPMNKKIHIIFFSNKENILLRLSDCVTYIISKLLKVQTLIKSIKIPINKKIEPKKVNITI